ncbi:MAG: hypothetical protein BWY10_02551 [Chloroflexi bacterium ADurb.Bin180]|nr:MAG: hypothetical protein BWY10_02551 [Chloroflexi bacterium ADurb.Bin180]
MVVSVKEHVTAILRTQALVRMHARASLARQRFGHKRGIEAVALRDGLDRVAQGHHRVGARQGIGVVKVDLLLTRTALVVGRLDGNAHLLQRQRNAVANLRSQVQRRKVKVTGIVLRHGARLGLSVALEKVELDLRASVKGVAQRAAIGDGVLQNAPRISGKRPTRGVKGVADEARRALWRLRPRQKSIGRWIGAQHHIALGNAGKALDRRAVKVDTQLQSCAQPGHRDGHVLDCAIEVGEL